VKSGKSCLKNFVDTPDVNQIRATLARDPWIQSGLIEIKDIQPWTILLESPEKGSRALYQPLLARRRTAAFLTRPSFSEGGSMHA